VISATHPWLAAAPDTHGSASPPEELAKFKNPYSYKDLFLQEVVANILTVWRRLTACLF